MVHTRTRQMIDLELVPLQKPQPAIGSAITFSHAANAVSSSPSLTRSPSTRLLLQPGECSELVVRIRNQWEAPLQIQCAVMGDIPSDWWQRRTEETTLQPNEQMDEVLSFEIDPDFFERPFSHSQLPLRLDYQGQLKVTARTTPRGNSEEYISPLHVWVQPSSLYLDFLPDIYRRIDIVGRFLKIFETTFEPTVDILDHLWAYLDPLTAPQSMLPFLSHWVGWEFQGPLSLEQQRTLIRYAMEIYRWRGTRRGLRFYLHLASGLPLDDHLAEESEKSIGIHETFSDGYVLGQTQMGRSTILGGHRPCHFSVRLRPPPDYLLDEALLRTIIEQEKPVFCSYELLIEAPP